jgi:hypothetical protein
MADEFRIESRTPDTICVHHIPHGHRYVFARHEQEGRRVLQPGPILENAKSPVPAMALLTAARTFAESKARAAGLID